MGTAVQDGKDHLTMEETEPQGEGTEAQRVKWRLIQLSVKPTSEGYARIQVTWSPQVTAWQVLNGDDVKDRKKIRFSPHLPSNSQKAGRFI